jgi:hypothetical protein
MPKVWAALNPCVLPSTFLGTLVTGPDASCFSSLLPASDDCRELGRSVTPRHKVKIGDQASGGPPSLGLRPDERGEHYGPKRPRQAAVWGAKS